MLLNRIVEKIIYNFRYIFCMYIRNQNYCKMTKMLKKMLGLSLGFVLNLMRGFLVEFYYWMLAIYSSIYLFVCVNWDVMKNRLI